MHSSFLQTRTLSEPAAVEQTPTGARNSLFAYQPVAPAIRGANPFHGTRPITLEARDGGPVGIEVVAGPGARIETLYDEATGCCAYLWGMAGHPDVPRADLLRWCVGVANSADLSPLRHVVGMFVVLIDDRRNRRVRMFSDHMGLRPWFVGTHEGRLVCGSDVWDIQDAGLNAGGVNYDAVASWVRYGYDCTGQSLLADFPQMGYGAVATWENGRYHEVEYAPFVGGDLRPSREDFIAGIHERMVRTFDALTGPLDAVNIALSGGYDSRYLAALACGRKHLRVEAFSVRDREAEGAAASMVAEGLGLDLQILRTDGSLWNMFAEPYHFTAGGFPMTKQLSELVAFQRPGVPCLNGFVGDPILRGTLDRVEGKLEGETREELAVVFQRAQRMKHTHVRMDLLDASTVNRCDERTLAVWRKHLARWQHTGRPFFGPLVYVRQRHFLSNNFLQHLDVAEGILPFTAWEIIQYKLQHDPACCGWETYEALFRAYFPQIAHVPHNSKMGARNDLNPKPSAATKTWAAATLRALCRSGCVPVLNRRKSIPRLIGALSGRRDVEVVAQFAYRLVMLDRRMAKSGLAFDWNAI
ncbi:MAG TPA: hypothetical protein VG269_26090 [Tepidisphaeraceae bacterium]|jgi:hypothetical protein|nr:hypothetical protein [Tepidisphaeraceae bacterium]